MDVNLNVSIPLEGILNPLLAPAAKTVGEGINSIFTFVLYPLLKGGIYTQKHLTDYRNAIENKIKQIPEENRDPNGLPIALKAFNESKYQLNDGLIRSMFSTLIAASVDNRKNKNISPRFPVVISQLSSNDARFLVNFIRSTYNSFPAYRYKMISKNHNLGYKYFGQTNICFNIHNGEISNNDKSLYNLVYLGICDYFRNTYLTDKKSSDVYNSAETIALNMSLSEYSNSNSIESIKVNKEYIKLTTFGIEFKNILLNN